ncbi:hypothetical protein KGP95_21700 [Burkholderia multivorans]|uniref:hypothetical protein n=1 Tax=Burkholderia multivorans TaxID=87883 RepID=UPI00209D1B8D|nr:hypothetical protein [Burkholderia multivorans]MCO8609145.1 hypothetical protein [Burkholderia multivorans]MCO8639949.1 hypothetical protein [Burkholderia multivorans]
MAKGARPGRIEKVVHRNEENGMEAAPVLDDASRGRESAGDVLETGGDRGEARDAESEQDHDFVDHASLLKNARHATAVPRRR